MHKMAEESHAPANRGFSRKPYGVAGEAVADGFSGNCTDPAQTRFFNSPGHGRRYPNGPHGCEIATIPPDRGPRRVVGFRYVPRA